MTFRGRLIAPYQREGVTWMADREMATSGPKGGFLCDEMGLGKTIQLIATMLVNPKKRTIIVVPKSIVTQWKEEINRFAPSLSVYIFDGSDRTKNSKDFEEFQVVIAPYSVLVNRGKNQGNTVIHELKWSRIILDEGHEIRSLRSKRHISVALIKADIRWIVSGTPVYNSMKDFVSLCIFIGLTKSYVQAKTKEIREMYVLRRTKEDVAKFNQRLALPPCDFQNVEVEMYIEEKRLYESVFQKNKEHLKTLVRVSTNIGMHQMDILECLLRVRQVMIHPQLYLNGVSTKNGHDPDKWCYESSKIDTLIKLTKEHPNEKTLIFCQFIEEMNLIQKRLGEVFRIDGSVDKDERVRQIHEFKNKIGGAFFLIQIKTGGQGLNLQEATRVYITAPSWNPATEMQAIARSHRTGQVQKVYVKKLVCNGDAEFPSVEQSIMTLQEHKSMICAEVLNDPRIATQIPVSKKGGMKLGDILNIFRV